MQVQTRAVANAWVAFAELGEEAVLLNANTGTYFGLDAVGTRIWMLLAAGHTNEEIRACLLDEYDVPADTLEAELAQFLDELEGRDLVTRLPVGVAR